MWYKHKIYYKATSGLGGKNGTATSVQDIDESRIDLTDMPLKYGADDPGVTGAFRQASEAFENKRRESKVEFTNLLDENADLIVENRGGKNSVKTKVKDFARAIVFTHNHPREVGILGGTFSFADIANFAQFGLGKMRTYRAAAKEGTYSITRGKNFDGRGLANYYREVERACRREHINYMKGCVQQAVEGKLTQSEYEKAQKASFNRMLITMHNALLDGQSRYGYSYTLERRKK